MAVRPIDAVQVMHNINFHHRSTPVSEFESGFNNGLNQAMWEITHAPTLTQPNEPLTWSDLEGIHYEPVYIVGIGDDTHYWSIVERAFRNQVWLQIAGGFSTIVSNKEYGKTWLAYRRPPKV